MYEVHSSYALGTRAMAFYTAFYMAIYVHHVLSSAPALLVMFSSHLGKLKCHVSSPEVPCLMSRLPWILLWCTPLVWSTF